MKLKILSADEAVVNEFLAQPGIRVSRTAIDCSPDGSEMSAYIFYEPAPSFEEQLARENEAQVAELAKDDLVMERLRGLAVWCVRLASGPDADDYSALKNAGQRQKWLLAHGAAGKDLADIMDLLTPEMAATTKKLAAEFGTEMVSA